MCFPHHTPIYWQIVEALLARLSEVSGHRLTTELHVDDPWGTTLKNENKNKKLSQDTMGKTDSTDLV